LAPWWCGSTGPDLGPSGSIWGGRALAILTTCAWVRPPTSSSPVLLSSERRGAVAMAGLS
jgi:hypothetical protein